MHPVVLGQQRRGRSGETGKGEPPRLVQIEDTPPECARGEVSEGPPPHGQIGIVDHGVPGRFELPGGVELGGGARSPVSGVAVAFEVEHGEAERARRELAGHVDQRVVDTELVRELPDPADDDLGKRSQDQRGQQHDLHPARSELQVPAAECPAQLRRRHRREVPELDRMSGHRLEQCLEQEALEVGETVRRRDGRSHTPGGLGRLGGTGWFEEGLGWSRQRCRHLSGSWPVGDPSTPPPGGPGCVPAGCTG